MPKPKAKTTRAQQRASVQLMLGIRTVERRFVRDLRAILRAAHAVMVDHLEKAGRAKTDALGKASGAPGKDIDAVVRHVVPQLGPKVKAVHKKMADGLTKNYNANVKEILPITLGKLPSAVQEAAEKAREWSISLVEEAFRDYAADVREVFGDIHEGERWETLRDRLVERGNVSESRAELIARDQTLKLNGAINEARQRGAGVESYTWSTAGDERVREEHAALDGQVFQWTDPPEPGHPGEDFQCRCVAIPVIPEFED